MSLHWYILYTKPGTERKVAAQLSKKGYESFCPTTLAPEQGFDRKKMVEQPLFPRYVFALISDAQLLSIRNISGVLQLVYWRSKPANINPEEIRILKEFTAQFKKIEVSKSFVDTDEDCQVTMNPYLNGDKLSMPTRKSIIRVMLPSLGYTLTAQEEVVNPGMLQVNSKLKMVS
jgi:transcription antitermination factor NusG